MNDCNGQLSVVSPENGIGARRARCPLPEGGGTTRLPGCSRSAWSAVLQHRFSICSVVLRNSGGKPPHSKRWRESLKRTVTRTNIATGVQVGSLILGYARVFCGARTREGGVSAKKSRASCLRQKASAGQGGSTLRLPLKRSVRPVGTPWYAFARLMTPFYASLRGRPGRRMATLFYLCAHPYIGGIEPRLVRFAPVWKMLNRRKTGLRRFTPV